MKGVTRALISLKKQKEFVTSVYLEKVIPTKGGGHVSTGFLGIQKGFATALSIVIMMNSSCDVESCNFFKKKRRWISTRLN